MRRPGRRSRDLRGDSARCARRSAELARAAWEVRARWHTTSRRSYASADSSAPFRGRGDPGDPATRDIQIESELSYGGLSPHDWSTRGYSGQKAAFVTLA